MATKIPRDGGIGITNCGACGFGRRCDADYPRDYHHEWCCNPACIISPAFQKYIEEKAFDIAHEEIKRARQSNV